MVCGTDRSWLLKIRTTKHDGRVVPTDGAVSVACLALALIGAVVETPSNPVTITRWVVVALIDHV